MPELESAPAPTPAATPVDRFASLEVEQNALAKATEAASQPADPVVEVKADPEPEKPAEKAQEAGERNPDGTFKPRNRRDDPREAVKAAVAKQREAERRASDLEARLAAQTAPKPTEKPADPPLSEYKRLMALPGAPKLDQFDTIEEFDFAVGLFVHEQKQQDIRQHQAREQASDEVQDRVKGYIERFGAVKPEDIDQGLLKSIRREIQLVRPAHDLQPGERPTGETAIADALLDSEHPRQLMEYLDAHFDDFQRIATLHPIQAIREMAKLDDRLGRSDAAHSAPAPAPTPSKAKPPIQPVGSSPVLATNDPPGEEASIADHFRYYNALDRKAGRR